MRERRLIITEPTGNGVEVVATNRGHALVMQTPAVRHRLLNPLDGVDRDKLQLSLERRLSAACQGLADQRRGWPLS
jgi:hypothetical protein